MDTAERTGPSIYDGFISYSHAADDLLAPRLQSALQRFAKPWWKRRAVRIFRDQSSLAANPHLWSSITEALDTSGWFVLLLSPDAASSEWVGKEIEHWVANKPADRILPVVTDGEFGWENGDITGSSVPSALAGGFSEEPRWVDLRFAKGDEHLDLQNPDFSAAVADIAATIRGVPKDELASEEVRQHRRTVRTAWAAGALVTVLAVVATVAGVFAIGQRNDARDNAALAKANAAAEAVARSEADENAEIALRNAAAEAEARELADANAILAQQNAEEATRNAQLAKARELAVSAINVLDLNPELATLLAIEAIDASSEADQPVEVINALWRAGRENRLVDLIEHGFGGRTHVALSNEAGRLVVTSEEGATVQMYDAQSLDLVWDYSEDTLDSFTFPSITPDGSLVAVGLADSNSLAAVRDVSGDDGLPSRVLVLDGDTGALVKSLEFPECPDVEQVEFSPDGRFLATGSGFDGCPREGFLHWLEVYETETWEPVAFLPEPGYFDAGGPIPKFDDAGRLFQFGTTGTRVYSAETFDQTGTLPGGGLGDVTPDGAAIAIAIGGFDVSVHDVESGEVRDMLGNVEQVAIPLGLSVTDDGRFVVAGSKGRYTSVFELMTGELLFRLPGGQVNNTSYDVANERLFTAHDDGTVKIWDLSQKAVGVEAVDDLANATWVNANSFAIGSELGAFIPIDLETFTFYVRFFDLADGTLIEPSTNGLTAIGLDDGRFVYESVDGFWAFFDPRTGSDAPFLGCAIDAESLCLDTGEPGVRYFVAVSSDRSEMVAISATNGVATDGTLLRLDLDTGEVIGEESIPAGFLYASAIGADWILMGRSDQLVALDRDSGEELWFGKAPGQTEISPSGRLLVFPKEGAGLSIVELGTWAETTVEGDFGRIRGMSFSADESKIALGNSDGILIFDLEELAPAQVIQVGGVSDMYWLDDETMLIGTNTGVWGKVSLSTDGFLAETRAGLRRSFTGPECATYRIDPCPTLEEIRSR